MPISAASRSARPQSRSPSLPGHLSTLLARGKCFNLRCCPCHGGALHAAAGAGGGQEPMQGAPGVQLHIKLPAGFAFFLVMAEPQRCEGDENVRGKMREGDRDRSEDVITSNVVGCQLMDLGMCNQNTILGTR
ncbi:hypothetical protein PVAP13_5KG355600 [Panicum virgatum]|uniref:Uncharacterized protein n=1 Tax=Panicum virgatum TaxID=38727 RepID=A0A8T0SL26_PANVG|nr:hypothetical protein PVAP13_5KG355600 [Panicum virgatum]